MLKVLTISVPKNRLCKVKYVLSNMNKSAIEELIETLKKFANYQSKVIDAGKVIKKALESGGKILSAGNGGSAADALHFVEELVGRFEKTRPPFSAVCLAADATLLTCILNDFGPDVIFSRQLEALANKGDVLVVFSTSGESKNIINALSMAKKCGVTSIALLGKSGGVAKDFADMSIVIPSHNTARIQEVHTLVLHTWLSQIESAI